MTSQQIRQQFLDFFAAKGHVFVPSSPVVPHDDPTLMFTNAGMNQFKPIFLGTTRPGHRRVANSQKCIRAGGKHNDLDDVGQDTYHHTFFEMLGNWSFGDYFKKEAIEWAWELLTKVFGIDKSRLHATYFQGDPAEGLEPDSEAAQLWKTVTDIDPTHIHPGNKKDNFWEMGDTGPCGPCSEIHIDLTPDKSGRELVNKGDARVMELWNLVFIQYNRGGDGKLTSLPAKHVDTGMGFERLCAVLQKKTSNYDTDVFTPIFEAIRKRTGAPEYRGTLPSEPRASSRAETGKAESQPETGHPRGLKSAARQDSTIDNRQSTILVDVSYRVIADHLRCLVFALTDGAIPSNEGRGYVLRRILRRAVRYGRQYLNMHEPFLCDLVPTVIEHMGDVFPELRSAHRGKNVEHVSNVIREEESSFIKTLDRGIGLFSREAVFAIARQYFKMKKTDVSVSSVMCNSEVDPYSALSSGKWTIVYLSRPSGTQMEISLGEARDWLKQNGHSLGTFFGNDAFLLHDTFGFSIDLTQLMAEEQGLAVDIGEYERSMVEARNQARAKSQQTVFRPIANLAGRTDDADKYLFPPICESRITATIGPVDQIQFVPERTCFYSEQGGQVSDIGFVVTPDGEGRIVNVVRQGESVIHLADVIQGGIRAGRCELRVDVARRLCITQNHTATHFLNWALREVLCPPEERDNPHVQQKGSLVDPEKTRFDFSHPKQLSEDELQKIEQHVKSQIADSMPVLTKPETDQRKAREINTLRAVFGEKYPDQVRVVSIGADIEDMLRDPKNPQWMKYSVEFCGGTHLKNSKEAEEFVLVHEEAVAKGVRRLVGLTAEKAREAIRRGQQLLEIAEALRHGRMLPEREPRASARAEPREIETVAEPDHPRGLKSAAHYDLTRLLRELSVATIPILTRHQLAGQIALLQESAKEEQKKSSAKAQRGTVEAVGDLLAGKAMDVGGVTVVVGEIPGGNADALRSGIDYVRNKKGSSAVLLATVDDGKVTLVAGMSRDVVDRGIRAGDLIKEICPLVGGKGGGRPDMAQGGGNDPKGLPHALERATEWIAGKLGT